MADTAGSSTGAAPKEVLLVTSVRNRLRAG